MESSGITVGEVLTIWLGDNKAPHVALKGLGCFIGTEKVEWLLRQPAPHALELQRCSNGVKLASLVGEKFMKLLASEYAYFCFPSGDTAKLTNVTRVLIATETFDPVMRDSMGAAMLDRRLFMPFLTLVVHAGGICMARSILLPIFRSALRHWEYVTHLPALLSSLCPNLVFRKLSPNEQVEKVLEELNLRGIYVTKELELQGSGDHTERYTVSVRYNDVLQSCERRQLLIDYYNTIVAQGKAYLSVRKSNNKLKRQLLLSQPDMKMWMHDLHHLLRFQPPYRDRFQPGFLEKVWRCDGWVPVSEVYRLLRSRSEETRTLAPTEASLLELLEQHDHFGRFQAGVCDIAGGEFEGQLCIRALYAHECSEPLFSRIFVGFAMITDPMTCPRHAWVPLAKDQILLLRDAARPLSLYDMVQFLFAFPLASLHKFFRYREQTPLQEQYDEKLSTKRQLFFLQFCLRAAVRDEEMIVRQMSLKGADAPVHWAIFPRAKNNRLTDKSEVPCYFFTGRVATLQRGQCDKEPEFQDEMKEEGEVVREEKASSGPIFSVIASLKLAKPDGFSPEDVERIFGTDRLEINNGDGENDTDDDVNHRGGCHTAEGAEEPELTLLSGAVGRATILDTGPAREQVLAMQADPNLCIMCVAFPKQNVDGGTFIDRGKNIASFKEWVLQLGLTYRLLRTTPDALEEMYEIRKRGLWDDAFVRRMSEELEITDIPDMSLLRQAMTRECESKEASYEIFEFTGDAVMDFLVTFDTFLLGEPWNNQVTSQVCSNGVLAHLLPAELDERLSQCYVNLDPKVKADIVEGILGAVYRSRMGLDRVRQVLRNFFQRIPAAVARMGENGERRDMLMCAMDSCPYLRPGGDSLEERYLYKCDSLIDGDTATLFVCPTARPFSAGHNSHYASTPFHRIQDKMCATHFTTGRVYSYRHIPTIDTPALFNRILSAFAAKSIAFVNEIITEDTHVTIDFDGANVRSCGVLQLVLDWFHQRLKSRSAMLLLDCSGMSVVTMQLKHSCHIHFPQATTSLTNLQNLMKDLRGYITKQLAMDTLLGEVVGFSLKGEDDGKNEEKKAAIGRVVLCTSYLQNTLHRMGRIATKQFSGFMDIRDILILGTTCRAMRLAALDHLCDAARRATELACLAGLPPSSVIAGDCDRGKNDHYVLMQVQWTSSSLSSIRGQLLMVHKERVSIPTESTDDVVSAVVREEGKILKPKQFILDVILPLREKSVFTAACWDRIIDADLVTSKKLRMYLNDKYDMIYMQEYRPLFLDTIFHGGREVRVQRPDASDIQQQKEGGESNASHDNPAENEYLAEIAHASVLRLTSLRSPEYRDVHGMLRSAWWDGCNTDETFCDFTRIPAVDDRLPSFDAYRTHDNTPTDSWALWVSALCALQLGNVSQSRESETAKTAALQPAYWTFDTKRGQARLWIAGEVVLVVGPCASLLEALEARQGMVAMARLLAPGVAVEGLSIHPGWLTAYSTDVFPLFLTLRKKSVDLPETQIDHGGPVNDKCSSSNTNNNNASKGGLNAKLVALGRSTPAASSRSVQGGRMVHALLLGAGDDNPVVGDDVYAAVQAAFRGVYRPSLFITSNREVFSLLAARFPCVVSPCYFKSLPLGRFSRRVKRPFSFIFVVDDTTEPYDDPDLVAAVWRSLSERAGRMYASTEAIRRCLLP